MSSADWYEDLEKVKTDTEGGNVQPPEPSGLPSDLTPPPETLAQLEGGRIRELPQAKPPAVAVPAGGGVGHDGDALGPATDEARNKALEADGLLRDLEAVRLQLAPLTAKLLVLGRDGHMAGLSRRRRMRVVAKGLNLAVRILNRLIDLA